MNVLGVITRCLLIVLLTGTFCQADDPCPITVALRFSDDPIFTRYYRDAIERTVQGQLAGHFGPVGRVDVVKDHAFWTYLDKRRSEETVLTPSQFAETSVQDKLFLISIEHRAGLYEIACRQIDGQVHTVGKPFVRTTPDRQWLAKILCLAVVERFAPVATVKPIEGITQVRLHYRGNTIGPRLAEWLEDGTVLQPFWIVRRKDDLFARVPIPYTVLRIDEGTTPHQATVISSLADPWRKTGRVASFQAIKINTCEGRFRLRLIDAETGAPVPACQVYAGSTSFEDLKSADRLPEPDRHGVVTSPRLFDRLAYIRIVQQDGTASQILLPITGEWCDRTCVLRVDKQAASKGRWLRDITVCVQDVQSIGSMLDSFIRRLNELNEKKEYESALRHLRGSLAMVEPLLETARIDASDLKARAGKLDLGNKKRLLWVHERIGRIGHRIDDLRKIDHSLDETIQETVAQNLAAVQIRLAEDSLKQGDIDTAIRKFADGVRLSPNPAHERRLEALRETWRIKDERHGLARAFVMKKWPEVPIVEIEPMLTDATAAFAKLEEVDDYLTAQRLLQTTGEHLRELSDLVDMLSRRESDADRQACEEYMTLTESVAKFQLQVGEYLKQRLVTKKIDSKTDKPL